MKPIELKRKRAEEVVSYFQETLDNWADSGDDVQKEVAKKSKKMLLNLTTKTEAATSDLEFLRAFYEHTNKIKDKFDKFDGDYDSFQNKIEHVNEIKYIVVFDVDDTLRDATERKKLRDKIEALKEKKKETEKKSPESLAYDKEIDAVWDVFFAAGVNDKPKHDVISLMSFYKDLGFIIHVRTGASDKYKEETIKYLTDNGAVYDDFRMRKEGVKIPDYNLKPSWIVKYDIASSVFASFDDREIINEKYRKKGVVDTVLVDDEFNIEDHKKEFKDKIEFQKQFFETVKKVNKNKRKSLIRP